MLNRGSSKQPKTAVQEQQQTKDDTKVNLQEPREPANEAEKKSQAEVCNITETGTSTESETGQAP